MATVKVKIRPSRIAGKRGTIYYQVTHRRVVKQITTDIRILPECWDGVQHSILPVAGNALPIEQSRIDSDVALLHRIIHELETGSRLAGAEFSVADIVARFRTSRRQMSVVEFIDAQIRFLTECNRLGTAKNYRAAMESLCAFLQGRRLSFMELTVPLVERYSEYLMCRGLAKNSISFHMRILRAVYNKAVRNGVVAQQNPFRTVYTGVDRTRKRALDRHLISRLIELDLTGSAPLSFSRDLFLFSLYTRGMSFVDIAFLRRDNIADGAIRYCRRKTKQQLCIRIEPCMQRILDRYARPHSAYVFPILKSEHAAESYSQYRISMSYHNRLLKRLAKMLGLQQGLSFYAARHSWATLARDCHVPVSVISAGMGHTSERTTRIYLTSLENTLIDNANKGILDRLNGVLSL